ncbi:autotransporter outer membrane beta-barrel domain-containing protein [Mesorhizobium sp. B2-3-12]|uniref:autotransporter outer membrane beta-barrel domain-containing protein n=1 Tax=Mesorhizobium sp. B2-3-12 TaxID=2589952 RepID=UPI0024849742|nr:autotransporter outer membrane beta-barrel domain-containing protein [Mesorhizobium sp. B2-3-12]
MPAPLHAQVTTVVGTAGSNGSNVVVAGTNGGTGHAPSPDPLIVNNNLVISSGGPVFGGSSTGGAGGTGGNAIGVGICPFCTPVALGGDGNNGAAGGGVIAGNTGDLTGSAAGGHGLLAESIGGRGGDGGSVTGIGNALVSSGGDAGNGGNGGSAEANAGVGSVINTTGPNAFGILARSEGGLGGDGGGISGLSPLSAQDAGNGGGGGSGGSASATNDGDVTTIGNFSTGMLVRSAGASGGSGGSAGGIIPGIIASGGNGGPATIGGTATGTNNGKIETSGDHASGMVVQSVGGGGGDGGGAFGLFGGGGAGKGGNNGGTVTGTNTGTIITRGVGSIGMLVESVGGGGGDGGGAIGSIALGGSGGGGGKGGDVFADIGGSITTGADGSGDGAHGIVIQSVGGGGGNGGFAIGVGPVAAVGVGGSGGAASNGGNVNVQQAAAGPTVETSGTSAIGILTQSVGGGGGNGGGAYTVSGAVSVSVGGKGGAGGAGGDIIYNVGTSHVTTHGSDSTGIMTQSVGGGGGNGGFALSISALVSVGVGGEGGPGGKGGTVSMTTGGSVETFQDRSTGIVAQSIGGGGGNGGGSIAGSAGVSVGIGRKGAGGGIGDAVTFNGTQSDVTTHGADSAGIIVQSVGGGGGNGGFSIAVSAIVSVGVGGSGGAAGDGGVVDARSNGSVTTSQDRSAGIIVQSIGGGGGNAGVVISGSTGVNVGVGGSGGGGGKGLAASFETDNSVVKTDGADSIGILVQSIGGGGGNGSFVGGIGLAASVGVGGSGGTAGDAGAVKLTDNGGSVTTTHDRSSAMVAQSIGGGGGNGGGVVGLGLGVNIGIGGKGAGGGTAGTVDVINAAALTTGGYNSHGLLAQSIGGGGGSGGFSVTAGGPSLSLGGSGAAAGKSMKVFVNNSGKIITGGDLSNGIFAQSVGGSGGDGGFALAAGLFAAVGVGGAGGAGGEGGIVEVLNNNNISTSGALSNGILAQSIGGGGGNGGSTGALAAGVFGAASVAIGGGGGDANLSKEVTVTHKGDIHVAGVGSKGILAQSVGGSGGNGGAAYSGAFSGGLYASAAVGVSVGGAGGNGGPGGKVTVKADGNILADTDAVGSGGIVAQSIGGGGGNGGRAVTMTGAVSTNASISLGVTVGGWGGDGGLSDLVTVETGINGGGSIVTKGYQAVGILAQSVAGSGGNGGDSWAAAGGFGSDVSVNATVSIGGGGGKGNVAGNVDVTNAMTIQTAGDMSAAIIAQSIGGGGGNGGSTNGATADLSGSEVNVAVNVGVGGGGGSGNVSGVVDVINSGKLTTTGDFSSGIVAQSLGGGGGMGGSSNAKAFHVGGTSDTSVSVNVGIGGKGGSGNDAACSKLDGGGNIICTGVHVDNSGEIRTHGFNSIGILAMSVGGGGGGGGAASTDEEIVGGGSEGDTSVGIGAAIGLAAGGAGNGGTVSVTNRSLIVTDGADSYGISANSIGGGGGVGGSATSGVIGKYAIGGALGGAGGGGGNGLQVDVTNLASGEIWTKQERSIGIFAQSVGGGGGAGGAGQSTGKTDASEVSVNLSLGGSGNVGGNGGKVNVTNGGYILTEKAYSHGILAQSIGGSGGVGGASGTSAKNANVAITLSLGGAGGDGGKSDTVHVTNQASGEILTKGDNSHGIFAQSVGGGGGAAGAGSTETGSAETAVTLAIGGSGGLGSRGGDVIVDNHGKITTEGYLSHGIFAQSIGGGGGASGAAASASKADMTIGGGASGIIPPINGDPAEKANGGYVEVNNDGVIITHKAGSYGIFAQSVGGGGGYGGTVTSDAAGDDSVTIGLGGKGGNGGDGGDVKVTVSGSIETFGDRAHGVVAQSVGGGGGVGGDAKGKTSNALGIGGLGGKGGDGGDVTVIRTGTITTHGVDAVAIIAQSVGGGGGIGGAGFGRFGATADGGSGIDNNTIGFNTFAGAKGNGGTVIIEQDGEIVTDGERAHGIVAQAVGGGGGLAGTLSTGAAGSGGGIGDAAAASATAMSQVWVKGASSYAMFGQSATGNGDAHTVDLTAGDSLFAQGADSVAVYGESTAKGAKGNITINLNGQYTIGGAGTGVAAMLVGGANNTLTNHSLLYAMGANPTFDIQASQFQAFQALLLAPGPVVPTNAILESLLDDFSPLAITGTSGDDHVKNSPTADTLGRVIGNIDLGGGNNSFENFADSSMVALKTIDLGGGLFTNDGLYTNQGIGVVAKVDVGGGFTQDASGNFVTDIDLNNQITDAVALTGAGDFDGTAPLNFLSIDKLFTAYTVAKGASMTDAGIVAAMPVEHPAAGFNFIFQVENGTDLVLTTDNDTFLELAQDPQSGVNDPGVFQLAQYLDDIEAASTPDNPMARLINLVRFLPSKAEIGAALTRLTPHYAVHTFDMINRETDIMLETARECTGVPAYKNPDGRCVWATISPQAEYTRDAGAGTTTRDDVLKTMSLGGIGEVGQNWSLGGTIGRTEFDSRIGFNGEPLSQTSGEAWQAYALAKYADKNYFVDFALGGGTGSFKGERDTHIDPAFFVPGETLEGIYLDEEMLPGIGNSVTYTQKTAQFGGSARLGFTQQMGAFYLQPTLQFDARWLRVSGKEEGSVAGFNFDGSANTFYAATPALEIGTDIPLSDIASIRLYGKAGVEFSTKEWEIEGRFAAAENLPGNPALHLTEAIDSPLYRVGAGLELNGVNGVGMSVRYNGAFGETVKQNAVSASLKVSF